MKSFTPLLVCITLLTISVHAAPLVEQDLVSPGDGLVTFDPNTQLKWLDVNATQGMNWVGAEAYGASLGYTHASTDQILAFLHDAGIPGYGFGAFGSRDALLANVVVQNSLEYIRLTIGVTDFIPTVLPDILMIDLYVSGQNADVLPGNYDYHFWCKQKFQLRNGNENDISFIAQIDMTGNGGSPQLETAPWSAGHFMVSAVPEPVTVNMALAAFGVVLGGVHCFRQLRNRKQAA